MFTRIVFDTAPTVSTINVLCHACCLISIEVNELFLTGSYFASFVLARLPGCLHRQDIEGSHVDGE